VFERTKTLYTLKIVEIFALGVKESTPIRGFVISIQRRGSFVRKDVACSPIPRACNLFIPNSMHISTG